MSTFTSPPTPADPHRQPMPQQRAADGPPRAGGWFTALILGALALFVVPVTIIAAVVISNSSPGAASTTSSTVVDLSVAEFFIDVPAVVPAGDVTLRISNDGAIEHNVAVRELGVVSSDVGAGGTVELVLADLPPGIYELYCEIAGHEAAGMVTTLTVVGPDGETPAAAAPEAMDYEAMDRAMLESILAFPAATEGLGNPVLDPTEVLADGTKVFDLTAEIIDWEVEPGRFVEAWTYNGVVPAPQILLNTGDKVQVRLVNNLPMGTDIHWHGVHTPNDQDGVAPVTQDLIPANGGTYTYEFVADEPAIGMYHAHNHAQIQVIRGMFGVIRIGETPIPRGVTVSGVTIPEDLEVAVDMPLVLNDAGTIGYSLNGKSFPATAPVVVNQGEWVNVTYYNEGLQVHPMHLHQFPQLVYAKDGIALEEPYWADTINIAPGERYSVIFRADDVGTWVWHCHILTHVEREEGMFGMVTAVVVLEVEGFDQDVDPVRPADFVLTAEGHGDHDE